MADGPAASTGPLFTHCADTDTLAGCVCARTHIKRHFFFGKDPQMLPFSAPLPPGPPSVSVTLVVVKFRLSEKHSLPPHHHQHHHDQPSLSSRRATFLWNGSHRLWLIFNPSPLTNPVHCHFLFFTQTHTFVRLNRWQKAKHKRRRLAVSRSGVSASRYFCPDRQQGCGCCSLPQLTRCACAVCVSLIRS